MKHLVSVVALLGLATFPAAADTLHFDFANVANTSIKFTGAGSGAKFTMTTTNVGGHQVGFWITDSPLSGLYGSVQGTYKYGAVTTTGATQTAAVTRDSAAGTNVFTIYDSSWEPFTASIDWVNILTIGTGGGLNYNGALNLTNLHYAGTNAYLLSLVAAQEASATATFQTVPSKSLTTLKQNGKVNSTSWSGSVAFVAPDGGMTLTLLGSAFLAVEALRRRVRA